MGIHVELFGMDVSDVEYGVGECLDEMDQESLRKTASSYDWGIASICIPVSCLSPHQR